MAKSLAGAGQKELDTPLSVLLKLYYFNHRASNSCSFVLSCLDTDTGVWTLLHSDPSAFV